MARNHKGGFIAEEMYWDIGTEDQRGQDGDSARDAAKKYNDHRHSAFVANTSAELTAWLSETQIASEINNVPGGYLQTSQTTNIRQPGDLAIYDGHMFMATSNTGQYIRLGGGLGGGLNNGAYLSDRVSVPIEMVSLPLVDDEIINLRRVRLDKNMSDIAEQVCFAGDFNVQSATSTEVRADIVASIFRDPFEAPFDYEDIFFPSNGTDGPIVKLFFNAFPKNSDGTFPMGTGTDAQQDEVAVTAQTGNPIVEGQNASYDVRTVQVHPTLEDLLVRCSARFGTLNETISQTRQQAILSNFSSAADMENKFDALSENYRLDILSIRLKVILNFGEGQ